MTEQNRSVSLWQGTDYAWWLTSDTSGALCDSIVTFTIPLVVLSITGSPATSSAVQGVWVALQVLLMIPGGVLQDRFDRRALMIWWGISGVALCALALTSINGSGISWPVLAVVACALGIRDGLLGNTSNAMLRGIVPDEQLPKAMSLNSARDSLIGLIGSPLYQDCCLHWDVPSRSLPAVCSVWYRQSPHGAFAATGSASQSLQPPSTTLRLIPPQLQAFHRIAFANAYQYVWSMHSPDCNGC